MSLKRFSIRGMKVNAFHVVFVAGTVLIPITADAVLQSWWMMIYPAFWFFYHCRDEQFGKGCAFYWVRQSIFAGTAAAMALINTL